MPHAAQQVGLESAPPGVQVSATGQRADVGHNDVDAAQVQRRARYPTAHLLRVGDVHRHAKGTLAEAIRCFGHARLTTGAEGHLGPFGEKMFDDGAADTARTATNQHPALCELQIHVISP